jgi:hypothetical protein
MQQSQQGVSSFQSWERSPLAIFLFFFSSQQAEDRASIRIKLYNILDP